MLLQTGHLLTDKGRVHELESRLLEGVVGSAIQKAAAGADAVVRLSAKSVPEVKLGDNLRLDVL